MPVAAFNIIRLPCSPPQCRPTIGIRRSSRSLQPATFCTPIVICGNRASGTNMLAAPAKSWRAISAAPQQPAPACAGSSRARPYRRIFPAGRSFPANSAARYDVKARDFEAVGRTRPRPGTNPAAYAGRTLTWATAILLPSATMRRRAFRTLQRGVGGISSQIAIMSRASSAACRQAVGIRAQTAGWH